MSVTKGVGFLAAKGNCAAMGCVRYISKLGDIHRKTFFKIFDAQVQPVLLYSSEVCTG